MISRNNSDPIGVLDSGLGGLSILRAVRKRLPGESFIYVADSLNSPYGSHNQEFIIKRTLEISNWLVQKHAKALLIACNTATTQSISIIRQQIKIPIIGVEPGIKPAVQRSSSGIIGIIATKSTLNSVRFIDLIKSYNSSKYRFICNDGHGLVEEVEAGNTYSDTLRILLDKYLIPIVDAGADVLVLGCTHYLFLTPIIHDVIGKEILLIDISNAVANQLVFILNKNNLCSTKSHGSILFYSTSNRCYLQAIASGLLHPDTKVIKPIIISSQHLHVY
ncbi:MAG: glutamate racemase [Burkholderia sp.]|nr:glutamate racemase [Burkholderia sp.]